MFGNFFKKKKPVTNFLVVAILNAKVMPIDRGERYEDPLMEWLEKNGLGEVTGGGTLMTEGKEIESCDVEIQLKALDDSAINAIKAFLEQCGAPRGSKLIIESTGQKIPFGTNEGLAVYLNGTDLPDEVYQQSDLNVVYEEFNRLLGSHGSVQSHSQLATETALYMYGRSFEEMKQCLMPFMESYPLCQKARMVQIA